MRSKQKTGLAMLIVVLAIIAAITSQQKPWSGASLTGEEQFAIYQSYLHKFPGEKVVVEDFNPEAFDEDTLHGMLSQEGDERWAESFPLGDRKYAIPHLQERAKLPQEAQDFYSLIDEEKQRAMDFQELQGEFGAGARFVMLSPIARSQTRVDRYYFYCTVMSGPLSASSGIVVVERKDGTFYFVDALILWVS